MKRKTPTTFATREDVYNIAMDLPVGEAKAFLDGLTHDQVQGLMTAEELAILKSNVAFARWRESAVKERLAGIEAELQQARAAHGQARADHAAAVKMAAAASQQITETRRSIEAITARLEALGDMDVAIQAEIDQAKAYADAIVRAQAAGVEKARAEAIEAEAEAARGSLNRIVYLRGRSNG